jgi:hypothetical protein
MERNCDKSLFLRRERDVWDRLAKEARLPRDLAVQLARESPSSSLPLRWLAFESGKQTPIGMPSRLGRRLWP